MTKPKKPKKKPKFNRDSAIISALKRTFSRSPVVVEVRKSLRQEQVKYKKDGTVAKVPAVLYPCAECNELHMGKNTQVDHIEPVVPLNIPVKHACLDMIIARLFCDISNLQMLCKICHKVKSKEENTKRREWKSAKKIKHIVYITTNKINGKFYIGIHSTEDYDDGYLGSGILIKKAIAKYSEDSFYRKILYVFETREEAVEKEIELVNETFVKNARTYNLALGGSGGTALGVETKIKISKALIGRDVSADTRSKMSKYRTGMKYSESTRKNMSIANRKAIDSGNHKQTKSVVCVNTGITYMSIGIAAKELGIPASSISSVCRGKRKDIKGLVFKYKV